ncbi:MAG: CehA/McbA family metallohydrolase [Luteibaculum sp.]
MLSNRTTITTLFILFLLFWGCEKKEELKTENNNNQSTTGLAPALEFLPEVGFISKDTIVNFADTLNFLLSGRSNELSNVPLSKLEILVKEGTDFKVVFDTSLSDTGLSRYKFQAIAPNFESAQVYKFKLQDAEENKTEKTLSVLVIDKTRATGRKPGGSYAFGGFPEPEALPLNEGIWMAGDLHVHTNYSSDASNRPMNEIIATAKSNGLTFLGVTDHDNHVNGDIPGNTWADPAYQSDEELVVLYGSEWTTAKGHGNTFSPKPFDYQKMYLARDGTIANLQQTVFDLDIMLSANHPSGGDPWGYGYDVVRAIEVWNSAIWTTNSNAQTIWNDQLNTGRRMTGLGGSDSHHGYATVFEDLFNPNSYQAFANAMGTPTTWVRAKNHSSESVYEAMIAGRVSISATPTAPRLVLKASNREDGEYNFGMGDNLKITSEQSVKFQVLLENIPNPQPFTYRVTVIKNGGEFTTGIILPGQSDFTFEDSPNPNGRSYYRVTLEGLAQPQSNSPISPALATGMVALSNPIYVNF